MQGGSAPQLNSSQVAKDQFGSNIDTAVAQQLLNQVNQVGPQGSLKYDQTGTVDVGYGKTVPQFTATQTLSPEQQAIYNKTTGAQNQALDMAPQLLRNVTDATAKPIDFSGAPALASDGGALRDQAYEALMSRSRQEIGRARSRGETQAANQGIAPGSEAWRRQTQGFDESLVDAGNQAFINAGNVAGQNLDQSQTLRNQWINEALTKRTQPISDLTALLGFGGNYQQPSYVNTPQANVAATDTTSPAMANYQGQLQQFNQQHQANMGLMSGLFGLAGSGLKAGAMFGVSDVRAKENIEPVGETYDGQNLWSYNYKGDPTPRVGLMAQEVERRDPGAVVTLPGGLKAVNYTRALEPTRRAGLFGFGRG